MPESAGNGAQDAQCIEQRDIRQIDLDALGGVFGIEEHIDARRLAHGLIDDLAVLGHVQRDRFVRDGFELNRGSD